MSINENKSQSRKPCPSLSPLPTASPPRPSVTSKTLPLPSQIPAQSSKPVSETLPATPRTPRLEKVSSGPSTPATEKKETRRQTMSPDLSCSAPSNFFVDLDLYSFVCYASIYFRREKSRLFHAFTLQELITFSNQVPIQPLHCLAPVTVASVLDIERKVLMFINAIALDAEDDDDASRMTLLEQLVYQSLASQEVFDEIVCFVMKETNGNPDETSQILAFQLLFVLLSQRRPSPHLLKYVVNYVNMHLKQEGEIGGLAVCIMDELLKEGSLQNNGILNIERFKVACKQMEVASSMALPPHLFEGVSVESVLHMEATAEKLLHHGIMPPSNTSYAVDFVVRKDNDGL